MSQNKSESNPTTNITNSKSFLEWFLNTELSKLGYDSQVVSILRKHLDIEKTKVSAGKDISKDLKDLVLTLANKESE